MKNYIYSMTGCSHWFELADQLHSMNVCEPVIWIGDGRHKSKAKETFGNCSVLDLDKLVWHQDMETFKANTHSVAEFLSFMESPSFEAVKTSAMKMMDRLDELSSFTRPHREAVFERTLLFLIDKVGEKTIDFGLFIENPHSFPQFLLKHYLIFKDIPVYYFTSATFGCFIKLVSPNRTVPQVRYAERARYECEGYYKPLIEAASDYEPDYMKKQRIQNTTLNFEKLRVSAKKFIGDAFKGRSYYFERSRSLILKDIVRKTLHRKLLKHYQHNTRPFFLDQSTEYIYFPLHYEPERTTLPDGGLVFNNQMSLLLKLLQVFPNHIIVVKEHPTQLYKAFRGWRSRSEYFYKMLCELPNVLFVDNRVNSMEIMRNSSFVATVTGTIAIEAAFHGIPALFFGEAWYRGCPGTISFEDVKDQTDLVDMDFDNKQVLEYLRIWENKSFGLSLNRSWEGRFGYILNATELKDLVNYLKVIIGAI